MKNVWYCPFCGYEVYRRGRCHQCRRPLVASSLPELEELDADDEVGYRLADWSDGDRGRLIVALNQREVRHRFEDDDLVVGADDEAKADALIDKVTARASRSDAADGDEEPDGEGLDEMQVDVIIPVYESAARLRADPTDMQADAILAEASAGVFLVENCPGLDEESWNAVGRVTRRLLAALGAEEALDDEIRTQAGVLHKLLEPAVGERSPFYLESDTNDRSPEEAEEAEDETADTVEEPEAAGQEPADTVEEPEAAAGEQAETAVDDEPEAAPDAAADEPPETADQEAEESDEDEAAGDEDAAAQADDWAPDLEADDGEADHRNGSEPAARTRGETVYELGDWLPEQRALLSIDFEEAEIRHRWEGSDVVVAAADEARADAVFEDFETPYDGDDDEVTYRAIEELFAATDRLANDPTDSERATAFVEAAPAADSAVPLGLDEALWLQVRSQTHRLVELVVSHDDYKKVNHDRVLPVAETLRNLLRSMV